MCNTPILKPLQEPIAPMLDFGYVQAEDGAKNKGDRVHVGVQCESTTDVNASAKTNVHASVQGGTEPCASTSACATTDGSADTQNCRLCGAGGESREWVGCESCELWVHLKCIGINLNPGTNANVFIKKFKYLCPTHVSK